MPSWASVAWEGIGVLKAVSRQGKRERQRKVCLPINGLNKGGIT